MASDSGPETLIKKVIETRFPGHAVESVHPSSFGGLYEVVTGTDLIYSTATADRIFVGHVIDTQSKADLTSRRWDELHSIDFQSLPFDQAIKTVRGNGKRQVAVFADPNCPYCQQLEHNIGSIDNVTIYTFLYPLEDLHPGATAKAHAIWCSGNRASSWHDWMMQQKEPSALTGCNTDPLAGLLQLGKKLDISMTPTVFFADGHRAAGVMSAEQFEQGLDQSAVVAQR